MRFASTRFAGQQHRHVVGGGQGEAFDQRHQRRRLREQTAADDLLNGLRGPGGQELADSAHALADQLGQAGGVRRPTHGLGHVLFDFSRAADLVTGDDHDDGRQFANVDFPNQAQHLLGLGGGRGGQQQQAIGLLADVGANRLEGTLKNGLAEGLFQMALDTAGERLIVTNQRHTIAAHHLSPYRMLGQCRGGSSRPYTSQGRRFFGGETHGPVRPFLHARRRAGQPRSVVGSIASEPYSGTSRSRQRRERGEDANNHSCCGRYSPLRTTGSQQGFPSFPRMRKERTEEFWRGESGASSHAARRQGRRRFNSVRSAAIVWQRPNPLIGK